MSTLKSGISSSNQWPMAVCSACKVRLLSAFLPQTREPNGYICSLACPLNSSQPGNMSVVLAVHE